eukprot:TRINITY_DN18067_c0_g1_i1.p1 TRINITY_DN18067_c0_g1~~TRINITY_DN18067_c0_g1_i1.p1  ORF type:complete len:161 (+),score=5.10 TRINITY_DN18067_c0_g1_i1:275-757(+)
MSNKLHILTDLLIHQILPGKSFLDTETTFLKGFQLGSVRAHKQLAAEGAPQLQAVTARCPIGGDRASVWVLPQTKLVVVQFQAHPIVNLIVSQCYVIFVDGVPLLYPDLFWSCARLSGHQLLQVPYRVILVALDPHLLPQPVVQNDFNHTARSKELTRCL